MCVLNAKKNCYLEIPRVTWLQKYSARLNINFTHYKVINPTASPTINKIWTFKSFVIFIT